MQEYLPGVWAEGAGTEGGAPEGYHFPQPG